MTWVWMLLDPIITMMFGLADTKDIIKKVLKEKANLDLTDEQAEAVEDAVLARLKTLIKNLATKAATA